MLKVDFKVSRLLKNSVTVNFVEISWRVTNDFIITRGFGEEDDNMCIPGFSCYNSCIYYGFCVKICYLEFFTRKDLINL